MQVNDKNTFIGDEHDMWYILAFGILFDRKCRANILSAVDNHAVLGLDIVWCYLCLQNVEELPDAGGF